ncbi:MAG: MFS transporter [Bacteroidaceae bacterium]|nr:MFS transporter [Bacteroidaceae bacterium]
MEKETLWNGNYWRVMVANFALFFAFYLLTPLLPLYLVERFDATKDVVGLVLSGYTLTALLARPFSGFLVDTFPRKRVLMVCFALFFIFFGGYLGASSLLLFTIVRTLHGAPFGALTVANSTMAIDVLPSSRRNEGIGYYGLSNNLAMAIAPMAAIYIYRLTDSFQLLFWLALIIAGLGMIVDAGVKPKEKTAAEERSSADADAAGRRSSWGPMRMDRFFLLRGWPLALNMVFFGFCFGVISNYLAIYSKEVMGITGGTGTWFLLVSLGLVASRLQGAKALREGKLVQNATEGTIISSFAYCIFILFPNSFGYYGSAILLGLGNGHLWPAFQNMIISMARHNERGTANSTLLISWDIGIGIGVLAGGLLSEKISYAAAFWTVAVSQLAGMALFLLFTRPFYLKRVISH